jgi:hypothetical protein
MLLVLGSASSAFTRAFASACCSFACKN